MNHMKLHPEKIWSCPECKKQFRRLDKYKDHQKIHQNDRTFLCVYCGKDFPTTKYMNRHLQTHIKEKVHKPEEVSCFGLNNHLSGKMFSVHFRRSSSARFAERR